MNHSNIYTQRPRTFGLLAALVTGALILLCRGKRIGELCLQLLHEHDQEALRQRRK